MNNRKALLLAGFAGLLAASVASAAVAPASGDAAIGHLQLGHGFVLRADDRFDPIVQRLLAEQSLKALPLRGGQLFYIVPVHVDPHVEQMQIRYLEMLLDRQDVEPSAARP